MPLEVGDQDQLAANAAHDYDADGTVETNTAELDGLVNANVNVTVEQDTAVVYKINGLEYRQANGDFS